MLIYAGLRVKKYQFLFHIKSAVCQVTLCLYTIVTYCDGI